MTFKKLKVGMTVYDVRPTTGLNRFNGKWATYPINIQDIDYDNNKVYASWNCNPYKWYDEREWKKWRLSRPE